MIPTVRVINSITLADLLFVLFLGLKLTGHITWSWWFVFAPMYVPYVIGWIMNTIKNYKIRKGSAK